MGKTSLQGKLDIYLGSQCFGEEDQKPHNIVLYKKQRFVITSSDGDFSSIDGYKIVKKPLSTENYGFFEKSRKQKDMSRLAPCKHDPLIRKATKGVVGRIDEDVVKKLRDILIEENNE